MTTERVIRIFAGTMIMVSVYLYSQQSGAALNTPSWLWLTLFVGVNLFQSGFSRWCLMEKILIKLGVKPGGACGTC